MSLFLPISDFKRNDYFERPLTKGQLYNLDTNEFMNFQFNPQSINYERTFNWIDKTFKGDDTGGDLQFINTGAYELDLPLLYMADPGAPAIEYHVNDDIKIPNHSELINKPSFEFVEQIINNWERILPDKRRPSRIKVIFGKYRSFDCVIKTDSRQIIETFEDLSAKEAIITLELREWKIL